MIPEQLKNLKFVRIKENSKNPFEKEWTKNPYTYEEILNFNDKNYGVICGYNNLAVIDCDKYELEKTILENLPQTFTVRTGGGGIHFYYTIDKLSKKIILEDERGSHLGEVQSYGTQVIGPGSTHPSGTKYTIINESYITDITLEKLYSVIYVFMKKIRENENISKKEYKIYPNIEKLNISDIWNINNLKKTGDEYYGEHPIHGSETGMNFWVNNSKNVWHCFRCDSGGGPLSAIAVKEGIIQCSEAQEGVIKGEIAKKTIKKAQEKYNLEFPEIYKDDGFLFSEFGKYTDFLNIAKEFIKTQPIYYDNSKIWWLWNSKEYRWVMRDETDILNYIDKYTKNPTVNSKIKNELLESLQRVGRLNKPEKTKNTWVQINDKIFDVDNNKELKSSEKYFITNPINLKVGNSEETPIIDRLFIEWVGEDYVRTLYEIIAYCILPNYPIHRIFCLVGPGSNGKTCFMRLLSKFLGSHNTTSTELDTLITNRFEVAKLHKKLVCFMGETNFNTLRSTSTLKRLTGQDLISFEFKNKTPFDDYNYAKIIIATNGIPYSEDKTAGFYRRWFSIKFPNTFNEKIDVINSIPEEEYSNLAMKSIRILKELLVVKSFHNEGSINSRKLIYEELSNPVSKFINEECIKDINKHIPFFKFYDELTKFISNHGYRLLSKSEVSRNLQREGYEIKTARKAKPDGSITTWKIITGLDISYEESVKNKDSQQRF